MVINYPTPNVTILYQDSPGNVQGGAVQDGVLWSGVLWGEVVLRAKPFYIYMGQVGSDCFLIRRN